MPKTVNVHPSERIDKVDFEALRSSARDEVAFAAQRELLDQRDRILAGFRVEVLDQSQYPGRITIHNGMALDYDGSPVTNEDQPTANRTVYLDGASTTFYVEIEFNEADSDVNARAFWDPTVDQGTDPSGDERPDGQETSANVSTRKTPDWKVVTPISTTGFQRDQPGNLDSIRIPLVKLRTDSGNAIYSTDNTNLVTEKAATVITRVISTTQVVLKHPRLFVAGQNINVIDEVTGTQASSITSVDYATGLAVIAAITAPKAGAIVRVTSASAPDFIKSDEVGSFRHYEADSAVPNHVVTWQDRMFQGDEVNGRILSQGHTDIDSRGDLNLASLKDYVDFIAGQLQELKWGARDPFDSGTADSRIPPGIAVSFPTTPRYFDNAGSVIGSRMAAITVGDGTNSRGDLNGATQAALQAAHDALPASGGRIFLKRGTYTLTGDVNITNTGDVAIEGEEGSVIALNGGSLVVNTSGTVKLFGVTIQQAAASATAEVGIKLVTTTPTKFDMDHVYMFGCSMNIEVAMPGTCQITSCRFETDTTDMASVPIISATHANSVMAGVWSECIFLHNSFTAAGGHSCIDLATIGTPTTYSANLLDFVDCQFGTFFSTVHVSGVHLGSNISVVQLTRCKFGTIAGQTAHVRASGGTNLKLNECVSLDSWATMLYAEKVDHVEVDAFLNEVFTGLILPGVDLIDCVFAKISNCDFVTNNAAFLGLYPGNSGIHIKSNTQNIGDIVIENNSIVGSATENQTGMDFELNGYDAARIRIINNYISNCAYGIVFRGATSNDFDNILVQGNQIKDGDGDATPANYLKIGIYGDTTPSFKRCSFDNNQILNCNPTNSTVYITNTSRHGIAIRGSFREGSVSGNVIHNVGNGSYPIAYTSAIRLPNVFQVAVKGNAIDAVRGQPAAGIVVSEDPTFAMYCTVSDNVIDTVDGNAGPGYGITGLIVTSCTFSGNVLSAITADSGQNAIGIGVNDVSNASWGYCTITGNTAVGAGTPSYRMIMLGAFNVLNCTITGNSLSGTSEYLVAIISTAGGSILRNVITGNSCSGVSQTGIIVNGTSATARQLIISGNNLEVSGGWNILVVALMHVSITGNCLRNTGTGASDRCIEGQIISRAVVSQNICYGVPSCLPIDWDNASNSVYSIMDNVIDQNGTSTTVAIDTDGSAGDGFVAGNLVDSAGLYNSSDKGMSITTGSDHNTVF